jgi:hypothetical protein
VTMLLGWRSRADLLRLGRLCRSDRPSARYKRYLRLGELARLHGMPSISNRENHAGFSTSQRYCFLV